MGVEVVQARINWMWGGGGGLPRTAGVRDVREFDLGRRFCCMCVHSVASFIHGWLYA